MDTFRTLFCLRCRRPMVDTTTVCPHCGADQKSHAQEIAQVAPEPKRRRDPYWLIPAAAAAWVLVIVAIGAALKPPPPTPPPGPVTLANFERMKRYVEAPGLSVYGTFGQPSHINRATFSESAGPVLEWVYDFPDGEVRFFLLERTERVVMVDAAGLERKK